MIRYFLWRGRQECPIRAQQGTNGDWWCVWEYDSRLAVGGTVPTGDTGRGGWKDGREIAAWVASGVWVEVDRGLLVEEGL